MIVDGFTVGFNDHFGFHVGNENARLAVAGGHFQRRYQRLLCVLSLLAGLWGILGDCGSRTPGVQPGVRDFQRGKLLLFRWVEAADSDEAVGTPHAVEGLLADDGVSASVVGVGGCDQFHLSLSVGVGGGLGSVAVAPPVFNQGVRDFQRGN